jgi:hypothetical protein
LEDDNRKSFFLPLDLIDAGVTDDDANQFWTEFEPFLKSKTSTGRESENEEGVSGIDSRLSSRKEAKDVTQEPESDSELKRMVEKLDRLAEKMERSVENKKSTRKYKYDPEEMADWYVRFILQPDAPKVSQPNLAKFSGHSQPTWSRALNDPKVSDLVFDRVAHIREDGYERLVHEQVALENKKEIIEANRREKKEISYHNKTKRGKGKKTTGTEQDQRDKQDEPEHLDFIPGDDKPEERLVEMIDMETRLKKPLVEKIKKHNPNMTANELAGLAQMSFNELKRITDIIEKSPPEVV